MLSSCRSPVRKIDHILVSICQTSVDSSLLLMLVAVDIQALVLFFCALQFPSSCTPSPLDTCFFFSHTQQISHLQEQKALSLIVDLHFKRTLLQFFSLFSFVSKCHTWFFFFPSLSLSLRYSPQRWVPVWSLFVYVCTRCVFQSSLNY